MVLVPLPFSDQSASKRRPAVIVSNHAYNEGRRDVVVMAVTGQLRPTPGLGEVWLNHWAEAGLLKPSVVKPVFATIEQRLIIRSLGALHASDRVALRQAIAETIG